MSDELDDIIVADINEEFSRTEIDVMIKIYRWTKSERNAHFFIEKIKKIPNYRNGIDKLRKKYLIKLVKRRNLYRITDDGVRTGSLFLELRLKNKL